MKNGDPCAIPLVARIMVEPSMPLIRFNLRVFANLFRKKKIQGGTTQLSPTDLAILAQLIEEGKIK